MQAISYYVKSKASFFFMDVKYCTVWGKSQETYFTDDPDKDSLNSEYY